MDILSKVLENAQQAASILDNVCAPIARGVLSEISNSKEKVARATSPAFFAQESMDDFISNNGGTFQEAEDVVEKENFIESLFGELWWEDVFESLSNGFFESQVRMLLAYHQRGVRGWAEEDVSSLDFVFTRTLGQELLFLAETGSGWPNSEKYPTYESWVSDLKLHGHYLVDYSSRNQWLDEDGNIREYKDIVKENKILEKNAKLALRWVSTNLTYLWD